MKKIIMSALVLTAIFGLFAVPNKASAATCDSFTMSGFVVYNGSTTRARFEYSTNYNTVASGQGTQTAIQNVTSNTFVYQLVTGLTENTTYYFRLTVSDGAGSIAGSINSFTTPACQTTTPAPTVNISADQTNLQHNGSTTVRWNSSNATSCSASGGTNGWSGSKGLSGSFFTGSLTGNTTFHISCSNSAGSDSDSVTVNVSPLPVQNPTVTISADQNHVTYNGTTTVRWNSSNATSCSASGGTNGWSGNKNVSGSFFTGNLTNNTTFHITCSNSSGSDSASTTITVGAPPVQNPTVSISADQTNLQYNGSTTIRWSSSNATSCSASGGTNGWSGSKSLSGSFHTGSLSGDQTYIITCSNSSGSASDSVMVNVASPQINNPTVSISADNSNLQYNGSTTVRWNSSNATSCSASGGTNGWSGSKGLSGSFFTGTLTNSVTFQISCSNSSGSDNASVFIQVGNQQINTPSVSIFANPNSISYNGTSVITWNSTNATSCSASGGTNGWSGSKSLSGSFHTGNMTASRTFSITCSNSTGSQSDSVTVTVGNQQISNPSVTIWADDEDIDEDDSTTIRWNSNDADSCTASGGTNGWSGSKGLSGSFHTGSLSSDRTFHITCYSDDGGSDSDSVTINVDEDNDDDDNDGDDVSVRIWADDTRIDEGDSTRIRWDSDNADDCEARGGTNDWDDRNIGTSGSFNTGDLDEDETFRIECENDDGDSDSDSVTIRVDEDDDNDGDRPEVDITADRTTLSSGQATTIRWDVEDADDCYASGGVGGWAGRRSTGGGTFYTGAMYSTVTFFLDCGNDEGNESDSVTVQVITTPVVQPPQTIYVPTPTTPAPIIRNTTIVQNTGTGRELVMLTIDGGDDLIEPNEERIYEVEWKNISGETLEKVALRIVLPELMVFENTNRGSFTRDDNTITLDLDDLRANETGDMLFTARAKSTLRNNELVVVIASMVYTDQRDNQGETVAYATHHGDVSRGSVLGANIFDAGFFPSTLLGWIFFLLLILILLLLVRNMYGKNASSHHPLDGHGENHGGSHH